VGDRYVLERMRAGKLRFGGEQSGHIIDLTRNTTGDGLLTAVSLFGSVVRSGRTLHELAAELVEFPQILLNVRVESEKEKITGSSGVAAAVERAERELNGVGRILVRPSGTEPLVRVMLEGPDSDQIGRLANDVADAIREATLG
jgi:phosphoglucosamine mutase